MSKIRISCETEGADIYYTLDGSTPDNSKNLYISEFEVNEACTIKAIAEKEGYSSSNINNKSLVKITLKGGTTMVSLYNTSTQEEIATSSSNDSIIYLLEGTDVYAYSFNRRDHSGNHIFDIEIKDEENNVITPYKKELQPNSATAVYNNYFIINNKNLILTGVIEVTSNS